MSGTIRHGTTGGYRKGCDCDDCRGACARYERYRKRQRLNGEWEPFVDAAPVRAHALALIAAGTPLHAIAKAAGVAQATLSAIVYPKQGRVTARTRPWTAEAVLAVRPAPTEVPAESVLPLVHGLVANGYTQQWIGEQLGLVGAVNLDGRVSVQRADRIAALAEAYSTIPGPSKRARTVAAKHGWTVNALWDALDSAGTGAAYQQILDMVAVQRFADGDDVKLTRAERTEAAWELLRRGHSQNETVRRLRVNSITWRQILAQLSATGRTIDSVHRREGAA